MIIDRSSSQLFTFHPFPTLEEEMSQRLASLTNEQIYDFLRSRFDCSRIDELKHIKRESLLQADSFGQTMLHWCAVKGDKEITKFIIDMTGVELFNLQTRVDQYTALHLAVHGGEDDVIEYLVDQSKLKGLNNFVDVTDIHGQTALHWAASKGMLKACQKLYDAMSSPAIALQMNGRLQTALHFAVQKANIPMVELLLSKDDVTKELLGKVDKYSQSALHWAAELPSENGKILVDLLITKIRAMPLELRKSIFLTRKNEGFTALHIAVHSASNESLQSLVNATKSDIPEFISALDEYGQSALHWASSDGNVIACRCLCDAMKIEEINIQVKKRNLTALHFAVQGGHTPIVHLLLQRGADKSLKDENDLTALAWAEKYLETESREDIIRLLK